VAAVFDAAPFAACGGDPDRRVAA